MSFLTRLLARNNSRENVSEEQTRKLSAASTYMLPKRRIYVNTPLPSNELDQNGEPQVVYVPNKIRTAKYTLFTFLPKNLFEQFRRVANLYFLFLVILQCVPIFGGENPVFFVVSPLLSIIIVTAFRDAFEDYKRRTQDNLLNRSITLRLTGWRNVNFCAADGTHVRVGDLVKLKNDEAVPADMIILSTSEPDGLCYVETKNLDGETNLKVRHAISSTSYIISESDCENANFYVESEPPHTNLYSYTGVLHFLSGNNSNTISSDNNSTSEQKVEPVSINDVLLRGCILRNTEWVIGLVMFTGTDTKIILNSGDTPSKRSRIEVETNFHVSMNFIILFFICLGSSIADGFYVSQASSSADFFEDDGDDDTGSSLLSGLLTFWICLIIFQNIVPISLYITIEMVKTVQAYFIHSDVDLYYEKLDYPCTPKTWNISDDLGQIEYIFSDKTGTLTQNVMEFKKCTINGVSYGKGETDTTRGSKLQQKLDGEKEFDSEDDLNKHLEREKQLMLDEMSKLFDNRYVSSNVTFIDSKLFHDLKLENQQSRAIHDFFSALALCHTVLADRPDPNNSFLIDYKAQSPDESALVGAARDVGFVFVDRHQETLVIEVMGEQKEFTLLNVLEFNSTRKRMSVIVRPPEGGVILICKGADRLRTLCIAYRVISDEEYNTWAQKYAEASSSINDREEKIAETCELIEHSLTLMGGTAIEDRLQEGVPECIATLAQAGIKLWVLTGDKTETAINIGFACNLLQKDMQLIIVNASDKQNTASQLREALDTVLGPQSKKTHDRHALVIDGQTLKHALSPEVKELFLDVGKQCQSVVCCRVSPLQKAKVVELVKNGLNVMTLSIGDGANDVSMIQEANIGVGIAGEEGRQAAMAADYAVAQFRYLTKLLLVHGRWSYLRIAEMISCFFYKNIVWTFAMFWFQFYAGFTATYLYDYSFITFYNLVFTAFPVMFLGAFDQDVDAKTSLKYPPLYKRGILQQDFTKSKFWLYVLDAIYQSVICFFIPFATMHYGSSHANGLDNNGLQQLGTLIAGTVVVTVNLYVGLNILSWTWMMFVVIGLSILSFYAWAEFYSLFVSFAFFRVDQFLYTEVDFWLTISLAVLLSILPRFTIKYLHKTYWPIDVDIVREQVYRLKKPKHRKKQGRSREIPEEDQIPIAPRKTDDSSGTQHEYPDSDSEQEMPAPPSPKLEPTTPSTFARTVSLRSEDQLLFMDSGKRQSFTGFAFSGEESGFESFRRSIYRPVQNRLDLHRAQSLATSTPRRNNNIFSSTLSPINRSRTLPSTLFRRRDPSPLSLSPNNPSSSDTENNGGAGGRRQRSTGGEEVELSTFNHLVLSLSSFRPPEIL
ncbi:11234_t:CDS:10 [Ambispora gerdemannii]|uniref:Phospholipid-transporting ATPase n=1 Tax=Ambispora gerdemannii TaxID=144530 RepID=A0A9N9A2H0_9GLOM|nr:11234_t:CDS:10 [Ambispora gerdemannii]